MIGAACMLIASKARDNIDPYSADILLQYGPNINSPNNYSTRDLCFWEERIRRTYNGDVNGVFAIDLVRSILNNITLPDTVKFGIIESVKGKMIAVFTNYKYLSNCVKLLTMCCLENVYDFYSIDRHYVEEGDEERFKEEKFDIFTKPIARLLNIKLDLEYSLLYNDIILER